jgi:hypothetical protein
MPIPLYFFNLQISTRLYLPGYSRNGTLRAKPKIPGVWMMCSADNLKCFRSQSYSFSSYPEWTCLSVWFIVGTFQCFWTGVPDIFGVSSERGTERVSVYLEIDVEKINIMHMKIISHNFLFFLRCYIYSRFERLHNGRTDGQQTILYFAQARRDGFCEHDVFLFFFHFSPNRSIFPFK